MGEPTANGTGLNIIPLSKSKYLVTIIVPIDSSCWSDLVEDLIMVYGVIQMFLNFLLTVQINSLLNLISLVLIWSCQSHFCGVRLHHTTIILRGYGWSQDDAGYCWSHGSISCSYFFLTRCFIQKTAMKQIAMVMNTAIITMEDMLILTNWDSSTGTGGLTQLASSENSCA